MDNGYCVGTETLIYEIVVISGRKGYGRENPTIGKIKLEDFLNASL